jgi:hypothetical protein
MSLSKRTRFEVFKRDKFTCQYCGKKAPDIVLQVDHIEPKAKGGTDDLVNLVTACDGCNAGKSDIRLSDDSAIVRQRDQLEKLQERQEQIEMMLEWHKTLVAIDGQAIDRIEEYWCDIADWYSLTEHGKQNAARWIRKYGLAEVLTAMRIASETYFRYGPGNSDGSRSPTKDSSELAYNKVGGICRVRAMQDEKPWLTDFYYVRAILRRRHESRELPYFNMNEAMGLLTDAFKRGADADDLKRIAKQAGSWTRWRDDMLEHLSTLGESA